MIIIIAANLSKWVLIEELWRRIMYRPTFRILPQFIVSCTRYKIKSNAIVKFLVTVHWLSSTQNTNEQIILVQCSAQLFSIVSVYFLTKDFAVVLSVGRSAWPHILVSFRSSTLSLQRREGRPVQLDTLDTHAPAVESIAGRIEVVQTCKRRGKPQGK